MNAPAPVVDHHRCVGAGARNKNDPVARGPREIEDAADSLFDGDMSESTGTDVDGEHSTDSARFVAPIANDQKVQSLN